MTKQATQPTTREQRALVRALERRFGQSVMPYEFQRIGFVVAYNSPVWRVTDVETGSYVQGLFYLGRLEVRRAHDGDTTSVQAA